VAGEALPRLTIWTTPHPARSSPPAAAPPPGVAVPPACSPS